MSILGHAFRRPLRLTLAAAAVFSIALSSATPAAQAQPSLLDLMGGADSVIASISCPDLDTALKGLGLKNETTTRSQLIRNINGQANQITGTDPIYLLIGGRYATQVANRALECGIVQPDPQELFPGSSQITDMLNLSSVGR